MNTFPNTSSTLITLSSGSFFENLEARALLAAPAEESSLEAAWNTATEFTEKVVGKMLSNPDAYILQVKNAFLGLTGYSKTKDALDLVACYLDATLAIEDFKSADEFWRILSSVNLIALDGVFAIADGLSLIGETGASDLLVGLGGMEQVTLALLKGLPSQDTLLTSVIQTTSSLIKASIFVTYGNFAVKTAHDVPNAGAPEWLREVGWAASLAQLGSYIASDLGVEIRVRDLVSVA